MAASSSGVGVALLDADGVAVRWACSWGVSVVAVSAVLRLAASAGRYCGRVAVLAGRQVGVLGAQHRQRRG